MSIVSRPLPNIKKKKPQTPFSQAKHIKGMVDDIFWSRKTDKGPRPANLKENVEAFYNKSNFQHARLRKLTIKRIVKHMRGEETLFFTAAWRMKQGRLLLMIDIDVKKARGLGTTQAAWEFAKRLNDQVSTLFPNAQGKIVFEASTHGKGVHGYVVIERDGAGNDLIAQLYTRFERLLKHLALEWNSDIEAVEVKGKPARWNWDTTTVTCGTLAKLPRTDIADTLVLTVHDLLSLPINYDVPKEKKARAQSLNVGSVCPMPDAEEEFPTFAKLGEKLFAAYSWEATGRRKIVASDVQTFAYILYFCTNNMNRDGSLPTPRIKALWTWLYEVGITPRPYDPHRITGLRNGFSAMNLLHWTDHRYVIGKQACKWQGSAQFMEMVENRNEEVVLPPEEHLDCNKTLILRFFIRPILVSDVILPLREPKTGCFNDTGQWEAA